MFKTATSKSGDGPKWQVGNTKTATNQNSDNSFTQQRKQLHAKAVTSLFARFAYY